MLVAVANVELSVSSVHSQMTADVHVGAFLSSCACCQVFVDSTGGVKVPMFIVAPKDVNLDSSSPCLLYGYGGMESCTCPVEFAGCVLKVL